MLKLPGLSIAISVTPPEAGPIASVPPLIVYVCVLKNVIFDTDSVAASVRLLFVTALGPKITGLYVEFGAKPLTLQLLVPAHAFPPVPVHVKLV